MATNNLSAALAFVAKEYPGQYEETDQGVTVGTNPTVILQSNPERMSLGIINIGSSDVYISPNSNVTNAKGILLLAGGGSFTCNVRDDLTLPTLQWWCVSTAAGGQVYTVEIDRFAPAAPAGGGAGS